MNIYRPPQGDYRECCRLISEAFNLADAKDNSDFFVMGDFNINYKDTKSPSFKELDFTMKSLGLTQLISEPTRNNIRNGIDNSSVLDLIFTNSDFISRAELFDINLSDHIPVMTTRKKLYVKSKKVEFKGRSYKNYNKDLFQDSLVNSNWDNYFANDDPNNLWDIMREKILDSISPLCPLRSFRVPEAKEPWITNEALEAIRDKDNLLKRARRTKSEGDWENARRAQNTVCKDINNLRRDYLLQQQTLHRDDPKKFWKTIGSIIPGKNHFSDHVWLKDSSTHSNIEQQNTADYMNKFFTNIGPTLAKSHKKQWVYYGETVEEAVDDLFTDTDEVIKLCREIETLKSSGMDEISSKICKDAFLVLANQLVHLFNSSFRTGIFPELWKVAKVIPLFKGGDRESVGNYRPISLLPLPGKLMEKIVHNRISTFLEGAKFLSENQGGFRKGFSTVSTIADLTNDLFTEVNRGRTTLAAFVDLKKAFDTVNFDILLKKLNFAGVRDSVAKWCKSYLTGRSQKTIVNGSTSSPLPISCGVPQGSVLGPLFFLVYVNDIQTAVVDCRIKLYADDSVLYQSGVNALEASTKLQKSLDTFCLWCDVNKLTINTKKTKLMVFGSRSKVKKANHVKIYMKGDTLQKVPTFKYLGLILDPTLNFNHHIASVVRNVLHKMTLLAKVKQFLQNNTALQIYKSMLLPYLDYADVIFHKSNSRDLNKLQRLQNRCLRICLGYDRRFSTERVHKISSTPFLHDRRNAHILNFMFCRKDNRALLNTREIRTRAHDAPLFNIAIPRCEAFKRSIGYFGASIWNGLEPQVRNTDSYLAFKYLSRKRMLHPLTLIDI